MSNFDNIKYTLIDHSYISCLTSLTCYIKIINVSTVYYLLKITWFYYIKEIDDYLKFSYYLLYYLLKIT